MCFCLKKPLHPASSIKRLHTSNTSSCKLWGMFYEKVEMKFSKKANSSFLIRLRAWLSRVDLISEKTAIKNCSISRDGLLVLQKISTLWSVGKMI